MSSALELDDSRLADERQVLTSSVLPLQQPQQSQTKGWLRYFSSMSFRKQLFALLICYGLFTLLGADIIIRAKDVGGENGQCVNHGDSHSVSHKGSIQVGSTTLSIDTSSSKNHAGRVFIGTQTSYESLFSFQGIGLCQGFACDYSITEDPAFPRGLVVENPEDDSQPSLFIRPSDASSDNNDCFDFEWKLISSSTALLEDCFVMNDAWYGGAERHDQDWPINPVSRDSVAFLSDDIFLHKSKLGSVLQPVWFTSAGLTLDATATSQGLNMSTNTRNDLVAPSLPKLCLQGTEEVLKYTVCAASNVKQAQQAFLNALPHPERIPDEVVIGNPIFSTWAQYKMDVDQPKVLEFAHKIVNSGLPHSIMEVDDRWSPFYGDFVFDSQKFPDPKAMIDELHAMGFSVTLWVIPFAEPSSAAYSEGVDKGYWCTDNDGIPILVDWWQGRGAILNVMNDEAVAWFVERLQSLVDNYGVDGYKFDAGEDVYVPENAMPRHVFAQKWAQLSSSFRLGEVRIGYLTQDQPVWVREFDKDSDWGVNNGLHSMITTGFLFGSLGYPFVLPDMIGGNAYGDSFFGPFPSEQLYVRWAQANALFPAMQFSIAPWEYNNDTLGYVREAVRHHVVFAPLLKQLARQSLNTGEPIVRPMFWADPVDPALFWISDQFMVGDDVLVAPVLTPDTNKRDIYLPSGQWHVYNHAGTDGTRSHLDQDDCMTIQGPLLLRDWSAPIDDLPVFIRVSASIPVTWDCRASTSI